MAIRNDIKRVEIVRENVDVIILSPEDIASLFCDGLNKSVTIQQDSYAEVEFADSIYLKLWDSANNPHYELGCLDFESKIFELIQANDITSIEVVFDDDEQRVIMAHWDPDSEWENTWQHSYIDEDGCMYIGIGEHVDLKGFFNLYYTDEE